MYLFRQSVVAACILGGVRIAAPMQPRFASVDADAFASVDPQDSRSVLAKVLQPTRGRVPMPVPLSPPDMVMQFPGGPPFRMHQNAVEGGDVRLSGQSPIALDEHHDVDPSTVHHIGMDRVVAPRRKPSSARERWELAKSEAWLNRYYRGDCLMNKIYRAKTPPEVSDVLHRDLMYHEQDDHHPMLKAHIYGVWAARRPQEELHALVRASLLAQGLVARYSGSRLC